jgi:ABC-type phosphate transport system substrate-binding protein
MKPKLMLCALLLASGSCMADIAVIVHPSNANSLEALDISRIFLGKAKSYPDGAQAVPVAQSDATGASDEFNTKVLTKSSSQLQAYWSKLVFTGKGTPPKEVDSDQEMLELIQANPSLIGYVQSTSVNESVRVVATF